MALLETAPAAAARYDAGGTGGVAEACEYRSTLPPEIIPWCPVTMADLQS
jgi:hypothetical protein